MRYSLPTDRLVNRLVPHFLAGRRFILFLQSALYPLRTLNDRFVAMARQRRIEACMSSQVIWFEWYLNHRFGRYLADPSDNLYIADSTPLGVDVYHEGSLTGRPFTVWMQNEAVITDDPQEEPRALYLLSEEKEILRVSFMVCVPPITIPTQEFVYMLSYAVGTYKLAGKSYLIKIDGREIEPTKAK